MRQAAIRLLRRALGPIAYRLLMNTSFVLQNLGWNADPNAPEPTVECEGNDLLLSFKLNAFLYPQFAEGAIGKVRFLQCWRHRLGPTNDEGWYMGQCRFSRLAPAWGEFYEVAGDLLLRARPLGWSISGAEPVQSCHYLFYFKDDTFECDAQSFEVYLPNQGGGA